jgi:hypothetical protein
MKPVRADFAPRRVPARWMWFLLALLAAAAVAAAGVAAHRLEALRDQRAALERAAAERQAAAVVVPKPVAPPLYERSAREMLAEHRLAWPQVLTALEATAIVGVTPVAVEMAASDGIARVEVTFTDHARLLEYLEALNAGQGELRWVLVQAQSQAAGGSVAVLHARSSAR